MLQFLFLLFFPHCQSSLYYSFHILFIRITNKMLWNPPPLYSTNDHRVLRIIPTKSGHATTFIVVTCFYTTCKKNEICVSSWCQNGVATTYMTTRQQFLAMKHDSVLATVVAGAQLCILYTSPCFIIFIFSLSSLVAMMGGLSATVAAAANMTRRLIVQCPTIGQKQMIHLTTTAATTTTTTLHTAINQMKVSNNTVYSDKSDESKQQNCIQRLIIQQLDRNR